MSKIITDRYRNSLLLFAILFCTLSGTFFALRYLFRWEFPISTLYRMFGYHNQHPLEYIAIVSVVFGLVGSRWIDFYGSAKKRVRWWTMTVAMLLTIVISSPFCGMLWQIHDMQAGFIPDNYLGKIWQGVSWGLEYGWLIALLSIPMNLVGFTIGYMTLNWLAQMSRDP